MSARALADLIEKEKVNSYRPPQIHLPGAIHSVPLNHYDGFHPRLKLMPPGFTPNGLPPIAANMRHPGMHCNLKFSFVGCKLYDNCYGNYIFMPSMVSATAGEETASNVFVAVGLGNY